MKDRFKTLLRSCAFLLVFLMLFSAVSEILQPLWLDWNNHYTTTGFYKEPENTIETIFLGSSVMINGVIPTQLYEDYGMSAYNLSTEQQPFLLSYYLLEEVYRLHKETLKTVVVDASQLRPESEEYASFESSIIHKGLDNMPLSEVKLRAVLDYTDNDVSEALNYIIPFIAFHTRWSELSILDYHKANYSQTNGTRGYSFTTVSQASPDTFEQYPIEYSYLDKDAEPAYLNPDEIHYLRKMKDFCDAHGLNLLLIRTPAQNWDAGHCNAVSKLAEELGLIYLDFNYSPLADELNQLVWLDSIDESHLNFYGASKLTDWLGRYITEHYGSTDVRGNPDYAHLEEQSLIYQRTVGLPISLKSASDITEYIGTAMKEDLSVFIMVCDEASRRLTDEQRTWFRETGLIRLADLSMQDSYLAVIRDGVIISEQVKRGTEVEEVPSPLRCSGGLTASKGFTLMSGGFNHGNVASCVIGSNEFALNQRGVNIVVYDHNREVLIDSACFDTYKSDLREVYTAGLIADIKSSPNDAFSPVTLNGRLQAYLARQQQGQAYLEGALPYDTDDLFSFLLDYRSNPDLLIILSAKDEASDSLTDETRQLLSEYGLYRLATLSHREPYIALIEKDKAPIELTGSSLESITYNQSNISISSSGYDAGNLSSIQIDGTEYSPNWRGLNAVVYNKASNTIEGYIAFDSGSVPLSVPDQLTAYLSKQDELDQRIAEQNVVYGPGDLFRYLNDYWADPDNTILISAKDDASSSLTQEAREYLASCGLTELAAIGMRESYAACIEGGTVLREIRGSTELDCDFTHENIAVYSAGFHAGNTSSIMIDGFEYSPAQRGLNIVVYDKSAGSVVSRINFDTCLTPLTLPDASAN